ncbi:MAG: 3-dehydroquinate synthase [Clostridia bacterium]|nr:3-dehydroquinate synthase [Clostridia bacterium]
MASPIIDIPVKASTPYTVSIGSGLRHEAGSYLSALHAPCTVAVITDSNVAPLYLSDVTASLEGSGFSTLSYVFPAGEASKNLTTYGKILEFLAENRLTRTDIILALGGGVTGDMAGFAAASYLRGIPYLQMPTTLLSAVDSSVGGKTAVDLAAGKNLVGAFKQPIAVLCDIETLNTLTDEVFYDGCAECIKYGVLQSENLLRIFETMDPHEHLSEIIAESVQIKADYVESDEFDTGMRRYLNLGHTLGHAIERCNNFKLMHGHAVAAGMVLITRIGEKKGITEPGTADRLAAICARNELPVSTGFTPADLVDGALSDKKRKGDHIDLIIPERLGKCMTDTVPVDTLEETISLAY